MCVLGRGVCVCVLGGCACRLLCECEGVRVCVSFTFLCMTKYDSVVMHYYVIDFCANIYTFRALV